MHWKRSFVFVALILAFCGGCVEPPPRNQDDVIAKAYQEGRSDIFVESGGTVVQLLPDDLHGGRHQRFLVRLATGQTVLISHNIDLAPRINSLAAGDQVWFRGEYEWNSKGGVIHYTHRDPAGRKPGGWIQHNGRKYR